MSQSRFRIEGIVSSQRNVEVKLDLKSMEWEPGAGFCSKAIVLWRVDEREILKRSELHESSG